MFQARLILVDANMDMIMMLITIMSERDEHGKRYEVRYEKVGER